MKFIIIFYKDSTTNTEKKKYKNDETMRVHYSILNAEREVKVD